MNAGTTAAQPVPFSRQPNAAILWGLEQSVKREIPRRDKTAEYRDAGGAWESNIAFLRTRRERGATKETYRGMTHMVDGTVNVLTRTVKQIAAFTGLSERSTRNALNRLASKDLQLVAKIARPGRETTYVLLPTAPMTPATDCRPSSEGSGNGLPERKSPSFSGKCNGDRAFRGESEGLSYKEEENTMREEDTTPPTPTDGSPLEGGGGVDPNPDAIRPTRASRPKGAERRDAWTAEWSPNPRGEGFTVDYLVKDCAPTPDPRSARYARHRVEPNVPVEEETPLDDPSTSTKQRATRAIEASEGYPGKPVEFANPATNAGRWVKVPEAAASEAQWRETAGITAEEIRDLQKAAAREAANRAAGAPQRPLESRRAASLDSPVTSPPGSPSKCRANFVKQPAFAPMGSLPGDAVDLDTLVDLMRHWRELGLEAKCLDRGGKPFSVVAQGYFKGGTGGGSGSTQVAVIEAVNELGSIQTLKETMRLYRKSVGIDSVACLYQKFFADRVWLQFADQLGRKEENPW